MKRRKMKLYVPDDICPEFVVIPHLVKLGVMKCKKIPKDLWYCINCEYQGLCMHTQAIKRIVAEEGGEKVPDEVYNTLPEQYKKICKEYLDEINSPIQQ